MENLGSEKTIKLTLDRMCIQTTNLCKNCQNAFDLGEITDVDITLGRILMNLAKTNKYLNDLTVLRIVETDRNIFIMVKKDQVEKMEKAEKLIKDALDKSENRKLHFFEKTNSPKVLVDTILYPIKPVSNTTIIIPPEGHKEIKLIFKSSHKEDIPLSANEVSKLTSKILGMETHYVFE